MKKTNRQSEKADAQSSQQVITRVSTVSIFWNVVLSLFKLLCGILGHSQAMVSDAFHSLSDVFGSFVVLIGARLSGKKADQDHPYGHERFECIASFILGNVLVAVACGIVLSAYRTIREPSMLKTPTVLPLIAAVLSIVVKEALYRYTVVSADRIDSVSLRAEAWHHRSDAFSSIGSLVGVGGAMLGFPLLDPIAGIIIAGFILKAAWNIFRETIDKVVDKACPAETVEAIRACITETEGFSHIDDLRTRQFASKAYVDLEISMPGDLTLAETHAKAKEIHDKLEARFPFIAHCMVHVNPEEETVHDIPVLRG